MYYVRTFKVDLGDEDRTIPLHLDNQKVMLHVWDGYVYIYPDKDGKATVGDLMSLPDDTRIIAMVKGLGREISYAVNDGPFVTIVAH